MYVYNIIHAIIFFLINMNKFGGCSVFLVNHGTYYFHNHANREEPSDITRENHLHSYAGGLAQDSKSHCMLEQPTMYGLVEDPARYGSIDNPKMASMTSIMYASFVEEGLPMERNIPGCARGFGVSGFVYGVPPTIVEGSILDLKGSELNLEGTKLNFEDSKLGLEDSKLGLEDSKLGLEDSKLGLEDSKLGLEDSAEECSDLLRGRQLSDTLRGRQLSDTLYLSFSNSANTFH